MISAQDHEVVSDCGTHGSESEDESNVVFCGATPYESEGVKMILNPINHTHSVAKASFI